MAPAATTPFMTGFCATEDLVTILPLTRVVMDGLSNFLMRCNANEQELLISLWSTADKSLPRESMQSVEFVGCRNALKSKALELDVGGGDIVVASAIPTAAAPVNPELGSWRWDAPATKMLELEREEAEKTGVSGAPKALEVIKSPDSGGNPRKETLELTGGGDIVVAPAISTAAAPVDVGNRELKEAARAVAVQGIAGKLPGVAENVVEKAGFGWLEERNGRAGAEANTARVALDGTAPVENDGQPDRGLLEIPPVPKFDVLAADAAGTNEANGF
jgi:hypothetical protein